MKRSGLIDKPFIDHLEFLIKDRLMRASVHRELLVVDGLPAGIGKTTALCEFAKDFGLAVIVPNREVAHQLRRIHQDVYSISELKESPEWEGRHVVTDIGVSTDLIKSKYKVEIITGFCKN